MLPDAEDGKTGYMTLFDRQFMTTNGTRKSKERWNDAYTSKQKLLSTMWYNKVYFPPIPDSADVSCCTLPFAVVDALVAGCPP